MYRKLPQFELTLQKNKKKFLSVSITLIFDLGKVLCDKLIFPKNLNKKTIALCCFSIIPLHLIKMLIRNAPINPVPAIKQLLLNNTIVMKFNLLWTSFFSVKKIHLKTTLKTPLLILVLSLFISTLQAQNITIRGRVATGDTALSNVTIAVKGSKTTSQTNIDGDFQISAPANGTLVFTSIGYTRQEVSIGSRTNISIKLQSESAQLNEVIVVGYGSQRRATVTGAVSTIQSDDLMKTPTTTTAGALVGKVQGITARQQDSRPGSAATIQIRNMGEPLFIIDGVPSDGQQFNQLGVADVENISILKDASAAIYGLRAANGVVLVTTKKGKVGGKTAINVNGYQGYQNYTRQPLPPDAATYLTGLAWSNQNRGFLNPITLNPTEIAKWQAGTEPGYQSVDYYKYVFRPNVPQSFLNASASGGSDNSRYYLSVSNVSQDATIKDFSFQRTNVQANLEAGLSKGLKVAANLSGRFEKRRQTGVPGLDDYFNPFLSVYSMWPTETPYANNNPRYINGTVHNININPATYPTEVTGYSRDDWRAMKGIFTATYELPFGLTAKGTYQYAFTTNVVDEFEYTYDAYSYDAASDKYNVVGGNQNPWRRKIRRNIEDEFAQLQLNYNKKFGDHSLDVVAAYERYDTKNEFTDVGALPQNNTVGLIIFADQNRFGNTFVETARAGYIGKINYNYKQKYLVELLGRYDGSFLYRKDSRYGLFPGVSLGWRVLQEDFISNSKFGKTFNELKLRASYGQTGSELGADPFAFLQGYNYPGGNAVFNGVLVTGVQPRGLPITTLSWVTNTSKNLGADFSLLKNKLSGSLDVFERRRTGLPAGKSDVLLPLEVGYIYPNQNLNSDAIRGVEGILTYSVSTKSGFSYSVSANGTVARNRSLFTYKPRFGNSFDQWRRSAEDRWSNVNFGHQVIGRFETQKQIDEHKINNDGQGNRTQLPGDLIFEDYNGDGIINDNDIKPIGYAQGAQPYASLGINTNFRYKGFSLQIDFAGATMQTYQRAFEAQVPFQNNGAGFGYLISDAWRRTDPFDASSAWIPGKYPAVRKDDPTHVNFSRRSDFWITNVKYIRLRNLEIGYDFSKKLLSKFGIGGLRVYVHGTNLFSIDNLREFDIDPEIGSGSALQYPQQRIYTFGFNLNL